MLVLSRATSWFIANYLSKISLDVSIYPLDDFIGFPTYDLSKALSNLETNLNSATL
jgi:hypothetical protein